MRCEDTATNAENAAASAREFAKSGLFTRMFREGMALVEETAVYLDGAGRSDSRTLSRGGALAYAGESMRLTTRLMQVASWLLVQRALREGEIEPEDAAAEKYRLSTRDDGETKEDSTPELPDMLTEMIGRTDRLYERVSRIDRDLYRSPQKLEPSHSEVARRVQQIENAFAGPKA